jgi:hypothetical protein
MTVPRPFTSTETAFAWLHDMLADEVKGWRVEVTTDWNGAGRLYVIRAYSMSLPRLAAGRTRTRGHAGWCSGQDTTLIGALAWLRHEVEDFMRKEPITGRPILP